MKTFKIFLFCGFVQLCFSFVYAEDALYEFDFAVFYLDTETRAQYSLEDAVDLFFRVSERRKFGFTLEPGGLSPFFRYKGPSPFSILSKRDAPEGPIFNAIFSRDIQPSWSRVIFVILPKSSGRAHVLPLEVSEESIPAGHALFYNLNMNSIGASILANQTIIEPGKSLLVNLGEMDGYRLPMKFAYLKEAAKWRLFYSSAVSASPNSRLLYLIHQKKLTDGPWRVTGVTGLNREVIDPQAVKGDFLYDDSVLESESEMDEDSEPAASEED